MQNNNKTPLQQHIIKKFVHTKKSFTYKFCMSEEERKEARRTRIKTLNSDKK